MVYYNGGELLNSLILEAGSVRGGSVNYDYNPILVCGDKCVGKLALETFYLLALEFSFGIYIGIFIQLNKELGQSQLASYAVAIRVYMPEYIKGAVLFYRPDNFFHSI